MADQLLNFIPNQSKVKNMISLLFLFDPPTALQGLVISLPYCFLSSEVQNIVKSHCKRWWLIQTVGRGQISARTSITASTTYSIHNKEILQVRLPRKGKWNHSSLNFSFLSGPCLIKLLKRCIER